MNSNIERPFIDLIVGTMGVLCLFIIIFLLSSWHNAKIVLKINASIMNGKYPMFVICSQSKNSSIGLATLVCVDDYLTEPSLKKDLKNMCETLKIEGLGQVTPEESWEIFERFLVSHFLKDKFYIFSLIKPSGVEVFKEKLDPLLRRLNLEMGFIPIPENWEFSIALKTTDDR